ncbi:nuclease [Catellatospora sp. TT07R-123]|uniref:ATP-binding protein n=1 Tax=Catellatospora sp. TT07R-123 TaxID=2733863 RepID=UPI001AFD5C65|nr:SbcC/MukB-like Walker B domain-containing protein [Catellatospora sp. TT07R-123]GHJ49050.1 nuclease [Catellatospora sp. TT07R-123]
MTDTSDVTQLRQFRLVRLQIVNWGTFSGYKDFPINRQGVLFTGPSGSGKSSLMDAHSTVLLPAHDQRFNASADLTARGSKQATRSVADYVRGAWSETNDEHEQSQVRYLRGGKPTWSAIGATYDDAAGSVVTAVTVKWFTGVDNDSANLKPLYMIAQGQFTLTDLEGWAERGFDTRWLKAAYPVSYPSSQEAYIRDLAAMIGLGGSKSALSLLGKAKAMKNVGDLNYFIRDNMLDRPETFAAAQRMVNTFKPLNDAFEIAHRAYQQEKELRDVPSQWQRYQQATTERTRADSLKGGPAEVYLRGLHLRLLAEEIDQIDTALQGLDEDLQARTKDQQAAYDSFWSLEQQWSEQGEVLRTLQVQLDAANIEVQARRDAYAAYGGQLALLGRSAPVTEAEFLALRSQLPQLAESARAEREQLAPTLRAAFAEAGQLEKDLQGKTAELQALRVARSLIPAREAQRRDAIAQAVGVPAADLPFAAELIDVAEGQERWRPAAEKVLRSFGLRLLVPERHERPIKEFIDTHDMRGIVEYSVVTATSAHRPRPRPETLAAKLTVNTDHPSGLWLAAQITARFDHVCVDTARELDQHRIGVTVRGTLKLPGNHYRKDDRPELTNPSSYILGANTAAKRAALEAEVSALVGDSKQANDAADTLSRRDHALSAAQQAAGAATKHTIWSKLDHWKAAGDAEQLEGRLAEIRSGDVDLQRLEERRDDAKSVWRKLVGACELLTKRIEGESHRQTSLVDEHEQEQRRPHEIHDEDDRRYLDEVLAELVLTRSPDNMAQIRTTFRRELERRTGAADTTRQNAVMLMKRAVDGFIEKWRDAAPDTSGDVEKCGADFAALHDEIAARKLPEAMTRFQQMISEDMVPSIGMLQRAIEKATQEIQERVDMVNIGLGRVEFNSGTHLQIACTFNPPAEVKAFRARVDELLSLAPGVRSDSGKAVAQFRRVRDLMALFTSDTTEARRWRTDVLDVRNSYTFYGSEKDPDGATVHTYRNTAANSGGEQEKLVAFCLAAALSYNLADRDSDGRPRFAPLMLDEAFSKSDETFSAQALSVFDEFGFQMLIAAPIRMSGIVEPFIGQAILVEKRMAADGAHSNAASATFGELAARRGQEFDGDAGA